MLELILQSLTAGNFTSQCLKMLLLMYGVNCYNKWWWNMTLIDTSVVEVISYYRSSLRWNQFAGVDLRSGGPNSPSRLSSSMSREQGARISCRARAIIIILKIRLRNQAPFYFSYNSDTACQFVAHATAYSRMPLLPVLIGSAPDLYSSKHIWFSCMVFKLSPVTRTWLCT